MECNDLDKSSFPVIPGHDVNDIPDRTGKYLSRNNERR